MNQNVVEVQGTLRPDGTLVLDEKPTLAAGRVRVLLQPYSSAGELFLATLQTIWDGQQARGHVPRSKEEIDAELSAMRDEWDAPTTLPGESGDSANGPERNARK